jgi:hypothetical protein
MATANFNTQQESTVDQLYETFRSTYPYVSVDKKVVARFIKQYKSTNVHMLYDYILSQDLADDVVL